MKLRGNFAFIGHKSKTDAIHCRNEGEVLRMTPSWRAVLMPVGMIFLFGPALTLFGLGSWWAGRLPPIEEFSLFFDVPFVLFIALLNVVFIHQLTRRRTICLDARASRLLFVAKDWGRTRSQAISFSAVRSLAARRLERLAYEDGTTAKANRVPSYIVSAAMNDGSAIRLFETTNRRTVEVLSSWLRSQKSINLLLDEDDIAAGRSIEKAEHAGRDAILG
jgi:hypothetical protein